MCGIIGIVGHAAHPRTVARALPWLRQRGPDGEQVWAGPGVALGHCRLAIIDPDARSAQPMERGQLIITFNGEIWNYREIREELRGLGRQFTTESDTEVLLAAWAQWGPECLERLEGMFAFALWDGETLWLAKDRWGKCPLAMAEWDGSVCFASEVKSLRFGLEIPQEAIREVPPATLVEVRPGRPPEERTWWELAVEPRTDGPEVAAATVARLLREGVAARTIADVPVCTLLSGGLDSLTIAFLAKQAMGTITAFTAYRRKDDADYQAARAAADWLGIELVEVPIPADSDALRREVREAVFRSEIATAKAQIAIAVACRHLARAIRERGFKVVFSGEGSDELWGSYKPVRMLRGNPAAWQEARVKQVLGQCRKNLPRSNKVFMSEGVECRLPFLHRPLVEYGLGLPLASVEVGGRLKGVLVEAAVRLGIPRELAATRKRVAFQVGLGLRDRVEREIRRRQKTIHEMYGEIFREGKLSEGMLLPPPGDGAVPTLGSPSTLPVPITQRRPSPPEDLSCLMPRFEAARLALEQARTLDEVKQIRDQAQALQAYIQQQRGSLEMQNAAAEIKVRAERRAGEMLQEMERQHQGGNRRSKSHDVTLKLPALEDLGVKKWQSSRWQQIARLPEAVFEEHIRLVRGTEDAELTSARMRCFARLWLSAETPKEHPDLSAGIPTLHVCPKCGFGFGGDQARDCEGWLATAVAQAEGLSASLDALLRHHGDRLRALLSAERHHARDRLARLRRARDLLTSVLALAGDRQLAAPEASPPPPCPEPAPAAVAEESTPEPSVRPVTVREALSGLTLDPAELEEAQLKRRSLRTAWARVPPGQDFTDAMDVDSTGKRAYFNTRKVHPDRPCPTIMATPRLLYHWEEPRCLAIPEVRRLCGFPEDWQDGEGPVARGPPPRVERPPSHEAAGGPGVAGGWPASYPHTHVRRITMKTEAKTKTSRKTARARDEFNLGPSFDLRCMGMAVAPLEVRYGKRDFTRHLRFTHSDTALRRWQDELVDSVYRVLDEALVRQAKGGLRRHPAQGNRGSRPAR